MSCHEAPGNWPVLVQLLLLSCLDQGNAVNIEG